MDMTSKTIADIGRGFAAGVLGGLLGSYVMSTIHSAAQRVHAVPAPQGEDSTAKAASAAARLVLHRDLTAEEKKAASPFVHYAFGASIAGAYGIAAELNPAVRTGGGALFGLAVWLGAHVIAVPALGWSEPVTRSPASPEAVELGAHLAYGSVVELVRRWLRRSG